MEMKGASRLGPVGLVTQRRKEGGNHGETYIDIAVARPCSSRTVVAPVEEGGHAEHQRPTSW